MRLKRKKALLLTMAAIATIVMSQSAVHAAINFSSAVNVIYEQNFNDTVVFEPNVPLQLEENGIVDDTANSGGKWVTSLGEPGPFATTVSDAGHPDPFTDPLNGINTDGQALQCHRTGGDSLTGRGAGYVDPNDGVTTGIFVATFRFIRARQELFLDATVGSKGATSGLGCGIRIAETAGIQAWSNQTTIDTIFHHHNGEQYQYRLDNKEFIAGGLNTSWHGIKIVVDLVDDDPNGFGIFDIYLDEFDTGDFVLISEGVTFTKGGLGGPGVVFDNIEFTTFAATPLLPVWIDDVSLKYGVRPENCGEPGTVYLAGDFNTDCQVNELDVADLVGDWLKCTDPADSNCDQYWE